MTKQLLTCPICGDPNADITRIPGRDQPLLGCWSCEADGLGGGDWLREVAEAVGAPGGGALKDEPERWLGSYINGVSRRGPPTRLPSMETVIGWHAALVCHAAAYRYLRDDRRLSRPMIRGCNLGFAQAPGPYPEWPAITLPVFAAPNFIVNIRKRFWPDLPLGGDGKPVKYVGMAGRGTHIYPSLPGTTRLRELDIFLVAGEFDALVARQRGLPAVSTTTGASLPKALVGPLARAGHRIAVMYDVGEEQAADRAVALLREAGAEAWAVDLPLTEKGADLSDYIAAGAQRADVLQLINEYKPTRRL